MTELITRSFEPDLEIRSAAQGGDGRTITGIAVPYSTPQRINASLVEQFAPGAFRAQINAAHRVRFMRDHGVHGGQVIGATRMLRDDAAGLYAEFRVSKTALGDETLELVKDGALSDLSIGFREGNYRRLQDGTIERTSAKLFEVAVVTEGAYGEKALIAAVRQAVSGHVEGRGPEWVQDILSALPDLPEAL